MGETKEVGVAELLSVLAHRKHSGRFTVSASGEEVQIFLEDGKVILVNSSSRSVRLGRILVRLGMVTGQQLDAGVREQDRQGPARPLGQILVEAGWLTRGQLATAAQEQCIEALTRVMVAEHGTFMFTRDARPLTKQGLVSLNTDAIVLEASRRADEIVTLRSLLPPATSRMTLHRGAAQRLAAELTPLERVVVEAIHSGGGDLAGLTDRVNADEASLWRTVIALRDRGVVELRGASSPVADQAPDAPPRERTVDEIEALGRAGSAGASRVPTLAEIRASSPASSQGIAAVTVVVREVIAAFNAGLFLRAFASFSEDHFRRQGPLPSEQLEALRAPSGPLPVEEQETFLGVRDVRLLPDGRISAILGTHVPRMGETAKVVIFTRGDDGWLIDAVIEAPSPRGATMTGLLRPMVGTSPLSQQAVVAR